MLNTQRKDLIADLALSATLAICIIAAGFLALHRGVWLDEAYSVWFSSHDLTFWAALTTRWIRDGHPVLYPAYTWLMKPVFGSSIYSFRFINFVALVGVIATGWQVKRTRSCPSFYLLYAVLVASTPYFILYAAELRSYFWQLTLSACLIADLRMIDSFVTKGERTPRGLLATTGLTSILLTNIHYLDSLVVFITLGTFILSSASRGQWRLAGSLTGAAVIGAIGLVVSITAFLSTTAPTATNYTTPLRCIILMATLIAAPLCNIAALFFAVRVIFRKQLVVFDYYATAMIAATCLTFVVFFSYNLLAHNFEPRYMMAAVPIPSAVLAHWINQSPSRRAAVLAICATALVIACSSVIYGLRAARWESDVPLIQAARRACSDTHIVALSPLSFVASNAPLTRSIGTEPSFRLAYRLVGQANGFPVETAYRGLPVRSVAGRCPTLLWVEHRYLAHYDDAVIVRAAGLTSPTGRLVLKRLQANDARLLISVTSSNY